MMSSLQAVSPTPRALLKTKCITAPLRQARAFDTALAFVLDGKRMTHQERALVVVGNTPDERLLLLASRLNAVASDVHSVITAGVDCDDHEMAAALLRVSLADLAAYCLIWATTGQRNYKRGCAAIAAERQRQRELLAAGKIVEDVASPATDLLAKFRVLFEECGEVAHAIDQVKHHGLAASNISTELTQVAAVCVAWLEALSLGNGGGR